MEIERMTVQNGGYRPNSGRKAGAKTILRKQLIELGQEFDSIVGDSFKDIISELLRLALESEDDNIRLKAASYLVNRILGMPQQKIDQTVEISESEEVAAARQMLQTIDSQAGE